ncbi:uncharacterized protein N7477_002034 [Penicillium maclennaniae]|uniref:uncharacterized protein n=1 Tax=Penicillium maclennaniae TaxID=1343394 RepID=UPI0025411677|nr:uncharacterized protein N7477_002034 [Penicillium maclennaniae]KAJ5682094.1 hypothetical protein N7477_002034 [Penicillium maclennaniae]
MCTLAQLRPHLPARALNTARRFTTSHHINTPAATVADAFLSRFQSLGPQTRTQTLDANQLQLLGLTLNRPSLFPGSPSLSNTSTPPLHTPVPPGYHLAYFTPAFLESELGADGTDASYNPEAPFTRRMWAGGEVLWPRGADEKPNPLRIGQQVSETTRVLSAEPKVVKKTGEEMIVVGVEKEFANEQGVSIVDRRNWVFRKALPVPTASALLHRPLRKETPTLARWCKPPVTLFRFSALTFNPHKIHYSLPWARDVEGHRDIVVHGPLNLISVLDLWRDIRSRTSADPTTIIPQRISYRATSPLYAGEEYQIVLQEDGDVAKVEIVAPGEVVAMKAEIQA